jgi:phosphocarrier protein
LPSTQDSHYIEREVEIRNPEGLHMRPAMQFVDCANGFSSRISIQKDSQCVDGKSIMQVTMLAATKGTKLKIIAEGEDAPEAMEALATLIQNETFDNVK